MLVVHISLLIYAKHILKSVYASLKLTYKDVARKRKVSGYSGDHFSRI